MGKILDFARSVFAFGPSSAPQQPNKSEIVALFGLLESLIGTALNGLVIGNAVVYPTRAALFADLARPANTLGLVYGDSTTAYNGIYVKSGASGSGSWSITNLLASFDQISALDIAQQAVKTLLVDADSVGVLDSQAGAGTNPRKTVPLSDLRRAIMSLELTSTNALATFTDGNNRAAAEIDAGGHLARADVTGKLKRDVRPGQRNQLDATGWPTYAAAVDTYPGGPSPASLTYIRRYYSETVFFFPIFGQSLAGGAQDDLNDHAITTGTPYGAQALMPSVGRKPQGVTFDTFVSSYEWDGTPSNAATETINSPMLNQMIATLFARTGVAPTMAAAAFSQGSRAWPQLGPGNEAWSHFMQGLRNAVQASHNRSRNLVVPAVVILWGEQNRVAALDAGTIRAHYLNMARQIKAAVREITGQEFEPIIFISVPANSVATPDREFPHMTVPASLHGVEGIRVLNPNYIIPVAQNVHPLAAGYNKLGKDIGKAILQECFGPGYAPLRFLPERMRWKTSTRFILPCDVPTPPIVVDTSGTVVTVPSWGRAGFQLFDRTDAEIVINTVTAVADDSLDGSPVKNLQFDLATAPAGGMRLSYAMRNDGTGINAGPLNGARGLIRDSGTDLQKWALPMFAHLPAY